MSENTGLPIPGYRPQSDWAVAMVTKLKQIEERMLRELDYLDRLADLPVRDVDARWLAIGRRQIEQGFMSVNRAIFQPGRAALPEDEAS